jgi:hypothetical protein
MTTELTILGRTAVLERVLGRGAVGEVWLARARDGSGLVLKFARDRRANARLIEEAQRLLGVDSLWCVRLLGVGRLEAELTPSADGSRLARGTPYLVLEHLAGSTLDPKSPVEAARALAW